MLPVAGLKPLAMAWCGSEKGWHGLAMAWCGSHSAVWRVKTSGWGFLVQGCLDRLHSAHPHCRRCLLADESELLPPYMTE